MDKKKILVVEDDEAIMMGLEENLKFSGFDVIKATDGPEGLKQGLGSRPDLILLDIMLPGMSGYEICRKLRDAGKRMPIIMLTARDEEFDKLHGFEMGADDYVTKPFSIKELIARIKAVLARGVTREDGVSEYKFGDCVLDVGARTLRRRRGSVSSKQLAVSSKRERKRKEGRGSTRVGSKQSAVSSGETGNKAQPSDIWEDIILTHTEFDLLLYFCMNAGKALSRDRVMNDVWGTEYYGTQRSLDSFVASLRGKIEKDKGNPEHILTVHGVGYKFAM